MNKLQKILWEIINTDDKKRHKVSYDVGKTLAKAEKKIRNLKLKGSIKIKMTKKQAIKSLRELQVAFIIEKWATQKMVNLLFDVQVLVEKKDLEDLK